MFAITTICVGSLYGQTTRYFQKITSMEELTEGNYLIVGSRNNDSEYFTFKDYNSSNTKYNAQNITNYISSNKKVITIDADGMEPLHCITIQENGDYYVLYDPIDNLYLGAKDKLSRSSKKTFNTTEKIYKDVTFTFLTDQKVKILFQTGKSTYLCFYTGTPGFNVYSTVSSNTVHPYLYKEVTYAREITSSNIGTICLPYTFDVSDNTDAKFYEIEGKTTEGGETVLVFSQVTTLEAGYPYIFKPEDGITSLSFTYTGTDNPVTTALNKNGLYGTFEDISDIKTTIGANVYLLSSNEIRPCGSNNGLKANRAYIIMNEVPEYHSNTSQAKAILRVSINDSSTGIEEVADSEAHPTEYHSVNGTKLSVPQKGLNIVKMNDGSTQKVFVP